jgi:hypothetical protein
MDGEPNRARRPARVDVRNEAVLILSDGSEVPVIVTDLSQGGFRLYSDELLEAGEQVTLRADRHGDVAAEIRWVDGSAAGGVFLTPAPKLG